MGLRDGALLSPAEFEAAKRRVFDALADTSKRDDDTATRRLSAGVRRQREAFCVVLDDTSGIKSHKGRLTRAATLAAAYCGGRVDLYLLDVRPAMGDDEQQLKDTDATSVDVGDLVPMNACCCCITSCYCKFPDCIGCKCTGCLLGRTAAGVRVGGCTGGGAPPIIQRKI